MWWLRFSLLIWALCVCCVSARTQVNVPFVDSAKINPINSYENFPMVFVVLLVRNKEHILPHVLAYFEKQNYPKKRMILWIRSDHNRDKSGEILKLWLNHTSELYRNVDVLIDNRVKRYRGEYGPNDWTLERRHYHMGLKENALNHARKIGADYVFFLDGDVLLTHRRTLMHLVNLRLPIVTPHLKNVWDVAHFKANITTICANATLKVNAASQAVLIKLDHSGAQNLTYDVKRLFAIGDQCLSFPPPYVDNSIFATSARCAKIPMFLNQDYNWGYFFQAQNVDDTFAEALLELIDTRLEMIVDLGTIAPVPEYLKDYEYTAEKIYKIVAKALKPTEYKNYINTYETKTLLNEIYVINLDRRPERREYIEKMFEVQDLKVTRFPGVDPKSWDILREYNITICPVIEPLKLGEVGCFLSHYGIWKRMVEKQQQRVLIFEDDIYFGPCFKLRLVQLMESARSLANYDFLYVGRMKMFPECEPWFRAQNGVRFVQYCQSSVGYILTLQGAEKLIAAKPLEKLMQVDRFIPIMYRSQKNKTLTSFFPVRNMIALGPETDLIKPLTVPQCQIRGFKSCIG